MQSESGRQDATGAGGIGGFPNARPSLNNDNDHSRYHKYYNMFRVGVPLPAVHQALIRDGLDPSILEEHINNFSQEGVVPLQNRDLAYAKYHKMLKMGIPQGAVRLAMERSGLDADLINDFMADAMKPPSRTTKDMEYHAAFGRLTNISFMCRESIHRIKDNDPSCTDFTLKPRIRCSHDNATSFTDLAWELLSCYISDNDYLESISLCEARMTDSETALLFGELSNGSSSVETLHLMGDVFGSDGIQSMVPFLKNSQNLTTLDIIQNVNVDTGCFQLIVDALHKSRGSVNRLRLRGCNIDNITALEYSVLSQLRILDLERNNIYIFPALDHYTNLEQLWLEGNKIGRNGFRSIAKLLRNDNSSLRLVDLTYTGMCDEDAEILANSLQCNTTLYKLRLEGNKIKEKGRRAFLKLLNDVSSIKATFNSNHTLRALELPRSIDPKFVKIFMGIDYAIRTNKENNNSNVNLGNGNYPHAAGRAKVVETQLNSHTRMELSHLQQIEYSYSSLFPQFEPVLLPNVLALVGAEHGKSELYRMLRETVSDLASIVNKQSAFRERMADNVLRIAALNDDYKCQAAALVAEYERQAAALLAETLRETNALAGENSELLRELESLESVGLTE